MEWCRAKARYMHWDEEVQLLREEMRRVLAFMQWHEKWWIERGAMPVNVPSGEMEGMMAYAARQAALRQAIYKNFRDQWSEVGAI